MDRKAVTGNHGEGIRSDCRITLQLKRSGGVDIEVSSKVERLYGSRIRDLAGEILDFYGIRHAVLKIEDSGALDFVLAARIEAASRQVTGDEKPFLIPIDEPVSQETEKERRRYSRLYLPGNTPKIMINAGIHGADAIILDLEDSVAQDRKQEARILVRNALRHVGYFGSERMVRINALPEGLADLREVAPEPVQVIVLPKCESAGQITEINKEIRSIPGQVERKRLPLLLLPIIESAIGIENAFSIASAAGNIIGLAIGLEDLTADLGVERSNEGRETLYARTRLINACRAAGIMPYDSVFSNVTDSEGLLAAAVESKTLGFGGMGCIHPRQVEFIHRAYSPSGQEIDKALRVMKAYRKARAEGRGVTSDGSEMIDAPVVKRARRILREAGIGERAGEKEA